jgi:hypothetical protein
MLCFISSLQHCSAIVELCARRFIVKKMQQKANAIRDLRSDIKSIVKSQATYDKWIKAKRMTVEEAAVELKPDMDKVGADLTKVLSF